jgi:hypothetical protein
MDATNKYVIIKRINEFAPFLSTIHIYFAIRHRPKSDETENKALIH